MAERKKQFCCFLNVGLRAPQKSCYENPVYVMAVTG